MKFYTHLIFCIFFFISSVNTFSQKTIWAKSLGAGTEVKQLATDKSGNVYTITYSNGIGIYKYNKNGQLVWIKSIAAGTTNFSTKHASIDIDQGGNLIIAGTFEAGSDFDPGPSVVSLFSAGRTDFFIEKLDSMGIFKWVKKIGSTGDDDNYCMKLDKQDNIFLTGTVDGTIDFDPGPGIYNSTGGDGDMYVCKLSGPGGARGCTNC